MHPQVDFCYSKDCLDHIYTFVFYRWDFRKTMGSLSISSVDHITATMLDTSVVPTRENAWDINISQTEYNVTSLNCTTPSPGNMPGPEAEAASMEAVVGISVLFCIIGFIGIVGNSLVITVVLIDRKMRQSVTNIFIMNLAISDLLIMLFGVPEILQFMLNRGWILGLVLCKFNRFVLVVSLYASILSLVSVCVER